MFAFLCVALSCVGSSYVHFIHPRNPTKCIVPSRHGLWKLEMVLLCLNNIEFGGISACNPLKVIRRFGGTFIFQFKVLFSILFHSDFLLSLFLNLENGLGIFLRRFVDSQRTARRYLPEDTVCHNQRCETLKSYTRLFSCGLMQICWNKVDSSSNSLATHPSLSMKLRFSLTGACCVDEQSLC
jgi:hypothetical protein